MTLNEMATSGQEDLPSDRRQILIGWMLHALTASGVLCGLLSIISILDGSPRAALIWLMVAMVIDGLDGPIARKIAVDRLIPNMDGHALDLIIDYLTCVVAPALFIHQFELLPKGFDLIGVFLILLSSLYCFGRRDLMDEDNAFRGFPAMWNLVVNAMFVLHPSPTVAAVVVVVMSAFTVSNIRFPHPMRYRPFRRLSVAVMTVWMASLTHLTWAEANPTPMWGEIIQGAAILYFLGLAGVATLRASGSSAPARLVSRA